MKILISTIIYCIALISLFGQNVNSFKTSDGETLFYTSSGSGSKIIFLYGGPGYSVSAMKSWADSLYNEFECILFDQRGTGLSSNVQLDTSTINLERSVRDINDLRIYLNEDKLTLCGISWGGMLAQAYATYFPDKTEKIVLISTLGPDLSLMSAFIDNLNMRRFPEERDSLKYWNNQPVSEYTRMKQSFFRFISEFYDHKIGYEKLQVFFNTTTYHDKMGTLMWRDLYKNYDLKLGLSDYKGESIIIRPRQDPVPAETICQIKELLPQTRISTIERCGHFPDYEKPSELFKILRGVLH
jgi:proline iminopeptidase